MGHPFSSAITYYLVYVMKSRIFYIAEILMMIVLFWFIVTLTADAQERVFRQVDLHDNLNAPQILAEGGEDFVHAVELDTLLRPVTGDTLRIWLQHSRDMAGRRIHLSPLSRSADLIVICEPELLNFYDRKRHVFPNEEGNVLVFQIHSIFIVLMEGGRHPLMDRFVDVYGEPRMLTR